MTQLTQPTWPKSMFASRAITMMLVALVLMIASSPARAQWGTNGNNINNTNTGSVGVGTTSPGYALDVQQNTTNNATGTVVRLKGNSAGTNDNTQLRFAGKTNGDLFTIGTDITTNNGTRVFQLYDLVGGGPRLTVDASGNVGIGTTNPQWGRLVVNKSVRIDDDSGSASGSDTLMGAPSLYLGTTQGGGNFQFNSGGGIDLWQYNAAAWGRTFTFAKTGLLGIGTTAPGYALDVQANAQWVARFKKTDATNGGILIDSATGYNPNLALSVNGTTKWYLNSNVSSSDSLQFWESSGTQARFTLTQAGNLGIGTTTPNKSSVSRALTVNGSTDAIYELAIGDTRKGTMYHDGTNLYLTNNANGVLTFGTNNNEKLRVDASGNVGIGTTAPAAKLDVNGNISVSGNITASGNIAAKYQDVAEWVESSQLLPAGTVVVLDQTKSNQVIASSQAYDTRVAGVISAQPGITLGERAESKVLVATTGRVKVKVDASAGPIQIGDLLVTSDMAGVAKKSEPLNLGGVQIHRPGTLIGKALEPLAKGTGEILVLLSLQ